MSEDALILIYCSLIYGGTLAVLTYRSSSMIRTLTTNLVVLAAYSALLGYNLAYNSEGGSGLLWWSYLIASIGMHWLINIVGIIRTFFPSALHKTSS